MHDPVLAPTSISASHESAADLLAHLPQLLGKRTAVRDFTGHLCESKHALEVRSHDGVCTFPVCRACVYCGVAQGCNHSAARDVVAA